MKFLNFKQSAKLLIVCGLLALIIVNIFFQIGIILAERLNLIEPSSFWTQSLGLGLLLLLTAFILAFFTTYMRLRSKSKKIESKLSENENILSHFSQLIDNSLEALVIHEEFHPIIINSTCARLFGFENKDDFLKMNDINELLSDDTRPLMLQIWDSLELNMPPKALNRVRCLRIDGSEFWANIRISKIFWNSKEVLETCFVDVTDQITTEMGMEYTRAQQEDSANQLVSVAEELDIALRKAENAKDFQEKLLNTIPNPICIRNRELQIIQCNEAFWKFFALPNNSILHKKTEEFLTKEQSAILNKDDELVFSKNKNVKTDSEIAILNVRKHILIHKSPIHSINGSIEGSITAIVDITDRKIFENELKRLATVDSLTNSLNRRRFLELANYEFVRAERYKLDLCILMLDIDHFKSINDTYGHAVGDEALIAVSTLCKKTIRDTDIFGRLGGEEFAIILPSTDIEGGKIMAERLRKSISEIVIDTASGPLSFSTSIGITKFHRRADDTIAKALNRSDEALYKAKQTGRNKVVIFEDDDKVIPLDIPTHKQA